MEIISNNAELALANLMFMKLFRNIRILRTSSNNETLMINVNCVLGQRSRILKNWQNAEKRANMRLPMIAINRTGYVRNGERLNNLHNEVKYEMTSHYRKYDLLTPLPVDINYDVTIIAKYPSDIDLIASNFMIFFNSDIYVSMEHPKYLGVVLNNQIIMSDAVSEEHPDELDGSSDDFITSTFQFTFKTYLFGGNLKAKLIRQQILSSVTSSFISSYTYELTESDMDNLSAFVLKYKYPSYKLSTTMISEVTADISTYVENPELSDMVYDGFTPIIRSLNVGFYAVPLTSDFVEYMNEVDSYENSTPYCDRIIWRVDESIGKEYPNNIVWDRLD